MPRAADLRRPALVLALLLVAAPALALDPERALSQLARESWTAPAGAPFGSPLTVSQTPDGWLWLGTDSDGLLRFDGVRFVPVPALDALFRTRSRINRLLTDRAGNLWVGSGTGLARLSGGAWTLVQSGLDVRNLALTEAGDVLVFAEQDGAFRVRKDAVERLPVPPSFGCSPIVEPGRGDEAWISGAGCRILRLAGGRVQGSIRVDQPAYNSVAAAALARDGALWVATRSGVDVFRDGRVGASFTRRSGLPSDETTAVFEDRDGVVWIGTAAHGVVRVHGSRMERFGKAEGFPGGVVRSFYEDREGNLWIVTDSALCRLRVAHVVPWGAPEGAGESVTAVAAGKDGSIWTWADGGGLTRIKDGRVRGYTTRDGLASNFGGPLFVGRDGSLWIGHDQGVSRIRDGRVTAFTAGPIGQGYVPMFTEDSEGMLTFVFGMGLVRFDEGRVTPYRSRDAVTGETLPMPYSVTWGHDGTLWLATGRGLWLLRNGELRRRWSVPGAVAMVATVREDADGTLWIGTWEGLFRLKGNTTTAYKRAQGLPHDRATALVDDGLGNLWIGSPAGISRVSKKELEEIAAGRRQRASVQTLDGGDGMRNPEVNAAAQPNACSTPRGDLWFATRAGAVQLSPARLAFNRVVPPVSVEEVDSDGVALPLTGPEVVIPPGTRRVTISFTAASLLAPEKVRFRYRLDGFDREWVEAGRRREATYTSLRAGRYSFHVLAANNDGLWSDTGAVVRFRQDPRWYETAWFIAASAGLLLGTALAVHRWRIQRHLRIERELERRVKAALAEVQQLSGLLPICAWCKKIRDDSGYWSQLEVYVSQHTEAEFTHAICPDCATRMREE